MADTGQHKPHNTTESTGQSSALKLKNKDSAPALRLRALVRQAA